MLTESDRIEKLEDKSPLYITYSTFFTILGILMGMVASIFTYQASRIDTVEGKTEKINEIYVKMEGIQKDISYIKEKLSVTK